jgi:hypothetical protein
MTAVRTSAGPGSAGRRKNAETTSGSGEGITRVSACRQMPMT